MYQQSTTLIPNGGSGSSGIQQNNQNQTNDGNKKFLIINQSDADNFNRKAPTTAASFNTIKINPNNINYINKPQHQQQSSSSSIEMMNQNVAAATVASIASTSSSSISSSTNHHSSQSLLSSPYHHHHTNNSNKRRKQDSKTGKGLRHFSTKVCEKVRNKGTTTYNEVADELVAEFSADPIANGNNGGGGNNGNNGNGNGDQEPFDQKNIRRRVYDAINVLMAINIISKEKKEIKWVGLPTNAVQEFSEKEKNRKIRLDRIKKKKKQLRELLLQQIAFKNLIDRNQQQKNLDNNSIIKLPFIIVNTDKNALIDCSISRDRSEYVFNFSSTFEIHDDFEIMKRMGLAYFLDRLEPGDQLKFQDYKKAMDFLQEDLKPELAEMIQEKNIKIVE